MKTSLYILFFVSMAYCATAQTYDLRNNINMDIKTKWPVRNGETVINVCWEDNPYDYSVEKLWVREAVEQSWQQVANVKFVGWENCQRGQKGVRVSILDGHPHVKSLGKNLDGIVNGMELNFTFKNFPIDRSKKSSIKAIAIHEFGHALGVAHEQMRSDCSCGKDQGSDGGYYVTPCDQLSVMNYCNENWNNNGKLSRYDIEGIQTIYGVRAIEDYVSQIEFIDELGSGDQFENVLLEFDGASVSLHVDENARTDSKNVRFAKIGTYPFSIRTTTVGADTKKIYGFNRFNITLKERSSLKFKIGGKLVGGKYDLDLIPVQ